MKKNEYVRFNVEGFDYFMCDGKKYKKIKTVYQKSKHEYILELIDNAYNVWYMIVLCGGYTKGPYKSRHHSIKILNDLPSYNYFSELISKYYIDGYLFSVAYIKVVGIVIVNFGCLDAYGAYMINKIFGRVYNV